MSLLKHINLRNFKTLHKALWTESPQQIYTNFKKLLKGESRVKLECKLIDQSKEDTKQNFPLSIDLAFHIDNSSLYVQGWAAGQEIPNLTISTIEGNDIWKGKPWLKRKDVKDFYPGKDFKTRSGFMFLIPLSKVGDGLHIETRDGDDNWVKYFFPVQKISTINEVDLSRHDQYKIIKALAFENDNSARLASLSFRPLISIVVPVYNVKPKWLKKMIASVQNQTYTNWELCLCDDKSTKSKTIDCLKSYEEDEKIKIVWSEKNQNISLATNDAIKVAEGEFIGFMDNDDELYKDALFEVVQALNNDSDIKVIYTDEDKISLDGEYVEPYHKSNFCIDTLRSNNFMSHFSVVEKKLGDSVGWLREGYEGAQDHDLMLRLSEETSDIHHIPKVLYHWRKIEGSTAMSHDQKGYAQKAGQKAVKSHIERVGLNADVKKGKWAGAYRTKYAVDSEKQITIIIPFKDELQMLKDCIRSILKKTIYSSYDILLLSNNSEDERTFSYLEKISSEHAHINYVEYNVPFNYAEINNWAVNQTNSEYVLFLNNDITVISKGWMTSMAEHVQRKEIGAVGAKLLYPDGTIQHAGVVLGIGGVAGHAFKGLPGQIGHYYMDNIVRGISACTAACLLVERKAFDEVNGFDAVNLKVAFNDVDLCLKIREAGYKLIYTPYAELYHHESKSRGYEDTIKKINRFKSEESFMKNKWGKELTSDPFYSPKLSLKRQQYQLDLQGFFNQYIEKKLNE